MITILPARFVTGLQIALGVILLSGLLAFAKGRASETQPVTTPPQSPNGSGNAEVSFVLINEIKELRRAFQVYAAATSHTQITLERMKFQQTQVDHLQAESANLQLQIEEAQSNYLAMEESAKSLEKQLAIETDPPRRIEIERDLKNLLLSVEHSRKKEQTCRDRQTLVSAQLEAEKITLNALSDSVEKMEKVFNGVTQTKK